MSGTDDYEEIVRRVDERSAKEPKRGEFWLVVWLLFVIFMVFVAPMLFEPETSMYEQCQGGYWTAETCNTLPAE